MSDIHHTIDPERGEAIQVPETLSRQSRQSRHTHRSRHGSLSSASGSHHRESNPVATIDIDSGKPLWRCCSCSTVYNKTHSSTCGKCNPTHKQCDKCAVNTKIPIPGLGWVGIGVVKFLAGMRAKRMVTIPGERVV
jgi:hypothetical protein